MENEQLRTQLEERNLLIERMEGSYQFEPETRKRKSIASPPLSVPPSPLSLSLFLNRSSHRRQEYPRRAPSNISRSNSRTTSHQNVPTTTRLTLSPRLAHAHEARELQANLARETGSASGFRGIKVPSPASAVRGPTPLSARERIAYVPFPLCRMCVKSKRSVVNSRTIQKDLSILRLRESFMIRLLVGLPREDISMPFTRIRPP